MIDLKEENTLNRKILLQNKQNYINQIQEVPAAKANNAVELINSN
jgi:hypothetical protein